MTQGNRLSMLIDNQNDLKPESDRETDMLGYMADMLAEFGDMARRSRCETLVAMLALAQVEAAREAKQRRN